MENYSLLMGAAAVMKMAVEMAAVSMEKPSGALPRSGRCRNRDSCPPDLGFAMAAALEGIINNVAWNIRNYRYVGDVSPRKNPIWMYAGNEDVDRLSTDLSVKDLEKLVRKISSLNKKDTVPSTCRVTPYNATNALPQNHDTTSPLPPLPEGGDVEERAVVTDDNQASPKNKRKRDDVVDSGTSEAGAHVPKNLQSGKRALTLTRLLLSARNLAEANKRTDALATKLEQSEKARKKAEEDAKKAKEDAATVEELRKRLHELSETGQEYELEGPEGDQLLDTLSLLEIHADEACDGLTEAKIGLSQLFPYFFKKKEVPATFVALAKCFSSQENLGLQLRQEGLKVGVEGTIALVADSQQDVDWAKVGDTEEMETKKWQALIKAAKPNSKKILAYLGYNPAPAPSSSKPELIFDNYTATPPSDTFPASCLKKKPVTVKYFEESSSKGSAQDLEELHQQLQSVKKQSLMIMEQSRKSSEREKIALQQARDAIAAKENAVSEAAAASSRENCMLELMAESSLDMAGSFLDTATEDERVEARSNVLLRLSKEHGSNFWGTPERTRQIVDFKTRFRFAMIMIKICCPKLDMSQIVPKCLAKMAKRKRNFGKYDDIVTPVAEDMMDELLRMDAEFFVKGSYAEHSTRAVNNERKRTPDEAEELLAKIGRNHDDWTTPEPIPTPILKKRGLIKLNDEDMREAKKSLKEKGIKSEDVKNLPPIEDICEIIPPSSMIEYMKDIVTNKRKIPNEEISTMLANYSFNGKVPKKLGDPDKLIPTDISLQMADKSTAIPVGICEDVPVQVTNNCLILTDFVVLEMPEDDNMSIILGRPFLNTAGAVIDCNKGKVTFNVDDREHTVYFPKRIDKDFKFNWSRSNPMVQYKIYNKTVNLPFNDFCAAIRVPQWGSCEKIRGSPQEFLDLFKMICHGRSFSEDGGKISSIQLPAIRYFAYFITKCVLARKNGSKISIQDLAFLAAALQGDRTYNLGALIANRLATNREKGGICGGLIASRLLAMHGVEPHHLDIQLPIEKLDIVSMIKHEFVSDSSNLSNLSYRITFYKKAWRITKKTEKLVGLPAPALFNLDSREDWSVTEGELKAYIEGDGHRARDNTEEAEEHLDSSSDAASSSHPQAGHEEPPRFSSASGPYYDYAMYDPPAWNPDPRWG
ncbi:hypothetical protein QYE76_047164 [Lolium multiflorum]|uniref:Arabidopsis retrotransposon Orf1 C-terminal domain-containing protein n=1 Tax=Lolium multiflorum TaxID=4521 RepID=A0AAD8TPQ3_LOLMU|nr:hypothetical protein QYE76_047164 [Lolium multiflorum]